MTILQIGPYPISPECIHGGVESSVYGLSNELAKTQSVFVFDFPRIGGKDAQETVSDSLTIYRFNNTGIHNQNAVRRVDAYIEQIQKLNPDVCHIHGTGAISNEIHKRLQSLQIKTIVTVHGLLCIEKRNALKK